MLERGEIALPPAVPLGPTCTLERFAGEPVRIMRRLTVPIGPIREPVSDTQVIIVVDTETTGLDPVGDNIIELALRRVRIDATGIVEIGRGQSWLEDPRRPLDLDVARLTGLTDSDLQGAVIDEGVASGMLATADWICAHNSGFDRRFVERRLPDAAGRRWCCSCVDVDWASRGFDGRSLGWLLSQVGLCHGGHRALNDVDATIAILASESDGRAAIVEMVENAASPAWLVTAAGASFSVKDDLRRRGYRWNAAIRVWQREVPDRGRQSEEFWLARSVYCPDANPQALGPRFEPVDPTTRFL